MADKVLIEVTVPEGWEADRDRLTAELEELVSRSASLLSDLRDNVWPAWRAATRPFADPAHDNDIADALDAAHVGRLLDAVCDLEDVWGQASGLLDGGQRSTVVGVIGHAAA